MNALFRRILPLALAFVVAGPFSSPIDPHHGNNTIVFLVRLGAALGGGGGELVGINQVVGIRRRTRCVGPFFEVPRKAPLACGASGPRRDGGGGARGPARGGPGPRGDAPAW